MAIQTSATNSFSANTLIKSSEVNTNFTEIWNEVQFVGFSAIMSADQDNFTNNAVTTLQFDTEEYDIGGNFDTTTYTFTAPEDAYWLFHLKVEVEPADIVANTNYHAIIEVNDSNGRNWGSAGNPNQTAQPIAVYVTKMFALTAGNTVIGRFRSNSGNNNIDVNGGTAATWFQGVRLNRNDA